MKIAFALINLTFAVSVFNNLGFMRSVSKRVPEFHGSITNTGRLASVRKRTVSDTDDQDGLAGCRLARTGRGRKRLICPIEASEKIFTAFEAIEVLCNSIKTVLFTEMSRVSQVFIGTDRCMLCSLK